MWWSIELRTVCISLFLWLHKVIYSFLELYFKSFHFFISTEVDSAESFTCPFNIRWSFLSFLLCILWLYNWVLSPIKECNLDLVPLCLLWHPSNLWLDSDSPSEIHFSHTPHCDQINFLVVGLSELYTAGKATACKLDVGWLPNLQLFHTFLQTKQIRSWLGILTSKSFVYGLFLMFTPAPLNSTLE